MSGKKRKSQKKQLNPRFFGILCCGAVLLVALVVGLTHCQNETPEDPTDPPATAPTVAHSQIDPDTSIDLGSNLVITGTGSYAGMFMENGSNEIVSGVQMISLRNNSAAALQYAVITLEYADGESAVFEVSNIPAGGRAVVLEASAAAYRAEKAVKTRVENVVFMDKMPLQEDKIKIQGLDGAMNVTNISGEDITSDIYIYYKYAAGDVLYGGITFRAKIEGGLKKDEVRQLSSDHFDAKGSKVVMITLVDKNAG